MKKYFIFALILICCFSFLGCKSQNIENEIRVNDIAINKSHVYVDVNASEIILAQVFPLNATNQEVAWKSTNPSIVEVNDGIVTGISEGRATVVASSIDGDFQTSCIVYVSTQKLDYSNTPNNLKTINNLFSSEFKNNILEQNEINSLNSNSNIENELQSEENNEAIENNNYYFNYIFEKIDEINKIEKEIQDEFFNIFNEFEKYNENLKSNKNTKGFGFSYEYNSNGIEKDKIKKINSENNESEIIYEDENTIFKKFSF